MVKHFVGDIDLEMRGNRDTLEASKLHDSSPLNVRGEIDLVRQLRDVHLKPLLHLIQGLSVRLVADEGDGQTLGTKPKDFNVRKQQPHKIVNNVNKDLTQFDG